jgi:hypothetical protein
MGYFVNTENLEKTVNIGSRLYNSRGFISKKQTSPKLSFIANLDEICNVIMEEHKTYPLSAFLSDTGGAAGLFLGLNIIDLLRTMSSLGRKAIKSHHRKDTKKLHSVV